MLHLLCPSLLIPPSFPPLTLTSPCPTLCTVAEGEGQGGCLKSHWGCLIRNSKAFFHIPTTRACWHSVVRVGLLQRYRKNKTRAAIEGGEERDGKERIAAAVEGRGTEVIGRGKSAGYIPSSPCHHLFFLFFLCTVLSIFASSPLLATAVGGNGVQSVISFLHLRPPPACLCHCWHQLIRPLHLLFSLWISPLPDLLGVKSLLFCLCC